jgi:hypothetical protein
MNSSESSAAEDILELIVRNPYNQNVPVDEFYRVINHFYGMGRDEFATAIRVLDEEKLVDFAHDTAGDIERMVTVTEKGTNLAVFLFPDVFYGITTTPKPLFCP